MDEYLPLNVEEYGKQDKAEVICAYGVIARRAEYYFSLRNLALLYTLSEGDESLVRIILTLVSLK